MKTFKTIKDYEKYTSDFYDTIYSNKDFLKENDVCIVFSSSINKEAPNNQVIFGEPANVGADICMLLRRLPKELVKNVYKALKKVK